MPTPVYSPQKCMFLPGRNQVDSDEDHTKIHDIIHRCLTTRIFHFAEQFVLSMTVTCSCRESVRYVTHPGLKQIDKFVKCN
jgi:hypothetical protein